MIPFAAYCDGGCVSKNPSILGGTWAWCWVGSHRTRIKHACGLIEPADLGMEAVSNNVSELIAALKLIEALPVGWSGRIYTDSEVTMFRITTSHSFKGIPDWLRRRVIRARETRRYEVSLLAGHPTRAELARGYRERNGLPVSVHNQFCDNLCTSLSKEFQMRLALEREEVA